MPVARHAIHPEPECRAALVHELHVSASAASGHGRKRVGFTRDQKEHRFLTCKQAKRGRQKYISTLETHFDGNSLRYLVPVCKAYYL
jgi:hypothetical protein